MLSSLVSGRAFEIKGDPFAADAEFPPSCEPPPLELVTRAEWDAAPPRHPERAQPLASPVKKVQLVCNSECDSCLTRGDCAETVKELQSLHMAEDSLDDINFNFLIGGDGIVYEGRGWDRQVQKVPIWSEDIVDGCVVALIGSFGERGPPESMMQTFELFIRKFTDEHKLDKDCCAISI